MGLARGEHSDRRAAAVLILIAATAWFAILAGFDGNEAGIVGFVAAWTVMMVAMMVPSAIPFILLYQRGATRWATAALACGYLAIWSLVGIAAWALDTMAMAINIPAEAVLLAAGLYQLTPIKNACLRRCRTPADFLVERWRSNAFILGADHGRYCLGCCWALMAVLVVAGMMGIIWVVAIAAIVAVEKLSSRGAGLARWTGVALIALAIWKALA
ncbi:MAG: DUF2182 domain-containing protein [Ilumatobacteraceae bacterium]